METTTTGATNYVMCQWCGCMHQGMCSRVKEIEYHLDGVTIKRIVFH